MYRKYWQYNRQFNKIIKIIKNKFKKIKHNTYFQGYVLWNSLRLRLNLSNAILMKWIILTEAVSGLLNLSSDNMGRLLGFAYCLASNSHTLWLWFIERGKIWNIHSQAMCQAWNQKHSLTFHRYLLNSSQNSILIPKSITLSTRSFIDRKFLFA